jgi:hypothetical protein
MFVSSLLEQALATSSEDKVLKRAKWLFIVGTVLQEHWNRGTPRHNADPGRL